MSHLRVNNSRKWNIERVAIAVADGGCREMHWMTSHTHSRTEQFQPIRNVLVRSPGKQRPAGENVHNRGTTDENDKIQSL